MNIAYFNGQFLPKEEIKISPDDRGFLFADGIYEVMKWYGGFFFDTESHMIRLKRSLREVRIVWPLEDTFPAFATELINRNRLSGKYALVYLQVTRGEAPRTHNFPDPPVNPTVYSFVKEIHPGKNIPVSGVKVMLKKDIRWSRCDIKSVALLANTLSFQEAWEKGLNECIFIRDGIITEGSRSNIFFVIDNTLYTHPESDHILSGVTRKNILRIAQEAGIQVKEEAVSEINLTRVSEAFISNTSAEVTPVTEINGNKTGNGIPGPVTMLIHKKFHSEIAFLTGKYS
jgi:D-alanine transaminase